MPMTLRRPRLAPWTLLCLSLAACQATSPPRVDDAVELPAVSATELTARLAPGELLEILTFPDVGRMTLTGLVQDDGGTAYAVPVAKGQVLSVTLSSANEAVYFDVLDTSDPTAGAVFMGEVAGRSARIRAREDSTYLIRPRLPKALASQGIGAELRLEVERNAPERPASDRGAATAPSGALDRSGGERGAGRGHEATLLGPDPG